MTHWWSQRVTGCWCRRIMSQDERVIWHIYGKGIYTPQQEKWKYTPEWEGCYISAIEQDGGEERWQSLSCILEVKCRLVKVERAHCLGILNCMGQWLLIITNHVVTSAEKSQGRTSAGKWWWTKFSNRYTQQFINLSNLIYNQPFISPIILGITLQEGII